MLDIRRSGPSIDALVASMRDVPERVLPYATAIALTKAAKRGQQKVIDQMRVSFTNPVAYTLGATRIEIATKDRLFARIAVKDGSAGSGSKRSEAYLLPEVEGGGRNEKGMERALLYAGILRPGESILPGAGAKLDASGNISGATARSVLRAVTRPGASRRAGAGAVFAGAVGRKGTRGIWQRDGRGIKPLFIFTRTLPSYQPRLDFVGAAATAVRNGFQSDFYAAVASLSRKFT
jgi:hypothetical protein